MRLELNILFDQLSLASLIYLGSENDYIIDNLYKHCISTHFNTKFTVSYAIQHKIFKSVTDNCI